MAHSGLFKTKIFDLPKMKLGDKFYLIPFGDVHRDAEGFDIEKWKELIKFANDNKNSYLIGMGDYFDFVSTSERKVIMSTLKNNGHYDTQRAIEDLVNVQVKKFVEELKGLESRIVGLIEGNHHFVFEDGTTSTQRLAQYLGTTYLGASSFVRLRIPHAKGKTENTSVKLDVWCHHGTSGGRLIGTSINKVSQMGEIADADIYLMGHDHKKAVATGMRMYLSRNGNNVVFKPKLYVRTGGFLKNYLLDKRSYIVDKGLPPTETGVVIIEATFKQVLTATKDREKSGKIAYIENKFFDMKAIV